MSNEVIKKEEQTPVQITPENLLQQAIQGNASVDTIERILNMRKELKAEWAKEQFDEAMAKFQSECPIIKKKKKGGQTNTGQVAYYYAPLEDIVSQTKDLIAKNGFSYSIKTETSTDKVKSTCIVKHKAGHSEASEMEVPHGAKTNVMSESQKYAATATFTKRYAFINAFGIMTADEDTDAKQTAQAKGQPTVAQIIAKIKTCKTKEKAEEWKKWIAASSYTEQQKNIMRRTLENLGYEA